MAQATRPYISNGLAGYTFYSPGETPFQTFHHLKYNLQHNKRNLHGTM